VSEPGDIAMTSTRNTIVNAKTEWDEMAKACAAADRAIDRLIRLLATDDEAISQATVLALLQFGQATVTRLGEMLPGAKDPKLRHLRLTGHRCGSCIGRQFGRMPPVGSYIAN
jgi:hypothetical protein